MSWRQDDVAVLKLEFAVVVEVLDALYVVTCLQWVVCAYFALFWVVDFNSKQPLVGKATIWQDVCHWCIVVSHSVYLPQLPCYCSMSTWIYGFYIVVQFFVLELICLSLCLRSHTCSWQFDSRCTMPSFQKIICAVSLAMYTSEDFSNVAFL